MIINTFDYVCLNPTHFGIKHKHNTVWLEAELHNATENSNASETIKSK